MEKFLADYGLKWVGEDPEAPKSDKSKPHEGKFNANAVNEELKHHAPAYRSNLPKEIDT